MVLWEKLCTVTDGKPIKKDSGKAAKQLSLHTIEPSSCFCQVLNKQGLSPGFTDVITIQSPTVCLRRLHAQQAWF